MIFFTDFFNVSEEKLEDYGAFNISLINDLPLFIDPFLLFGSDKEEYKQQHNDILKYLDFLRLKSEEGIYNFGRVKSLYLFPEVKQNWLGYSLIGNGGRGLGQSFGQNMSRNMKSIYKDLGNEKISETSHLEKAALFHIGVGKDNISDFTCNLIKNFLLKYTEEFAKQYLNRNQVKKIYVNKVYFDYKLERWMPKQFILPYIFNEYVILSPKDILTKDENWINNKDLYANFEEISNSIPNDQLRSELNEYFYNRLPRNTNKKQTQTDINTAVNQTIQAFPVIIDYYIKSKEEDRAEAKAVSETKVSEVENLFVSNVKHLVKILLENSEFYKSSKFSSYDQAYERIIFLKKVIEENDGYKIFYLKGQPVKRESDLQVIFRLTWFASPYDINRESNNGRGPVDYAISLGAYDKSLVEFKLASNSSLKRNLQNQTKIYEKANNTNKCIKVILFFTKRELSQITSILKELKLENDKSIVLIDARKDNKISASKVKL